ncbi:hypothetical protein FM107_03770 [Sphingobacterium sp. JB170]|nr:hypothetical protein FM107_03770 [Sphingobacterium sp. JB170]
MIKIINCGAGLLFMAEFFERHRSQARTWYRNYGLLAKK